LSIIRKANYRVRAIVVLESPTCGIVPALASTKQPREIDFRDAGPLSIIKFA
jgi:hypothetical protein